MSSPDASREQYDALWRDLWANCHAGGPMARTRYRLAMRWLNFAPDSCIRLLDVGAGNGAFMAAALRSSPRLDIFGAEFSQAAIDIAHPSIQPRLARCDLQSQQDLPWGGRFPLITCMEVLEHLPDDRLALQNIAKALAPGGSLFVSVPAWQKNWGPQDVTAGHVRRYEPDVMRGRLEGAGLRVTRLSCWGGVMTWMYLRAGDLVGPEKVMSVNPTRGLARIAADTVYQLLKVDRFLTLGRGPQLLALAVRG
jgi:SAM-dependent methyltransferase